MKSWRCSGKSFASALARDVVIREVQKGQALAIAIQSAADFVAMNQPADVMTVPAGPVVSSTTSAATDASATSAIEQE